MAIRKIVSRSIGVDVITAEDLAANSITAAEISNGAVTENKIDTGAVTTTKIADSNITNAKLAADGFDAAKFTTGTLPIARIADGAVTAGKLASTLDLTGKTVTLPAGTGGKVLQVVFYTGQGSAGTDTTSTSFVDTVVTKDIITTSANSKILVLGMLGLNVSNDKYMRHQLLRNGTAIHTPGRSSSGGNGASGDIEHAGALNYLDSPNVAAGTTLTYKIQIRSENGALVRINDNLKSTITLLEIAA